MMINKTLIIGIATLLLTACHSKTKTSSSHKGEVFVKVVTIQVPGGWGYKIYADTALYITQPFIPVIAGKHPFPTEEIARKTGNIVVEKLKKSQSPSLDSTDLHQSGAIQ